MYIDGFNEEALHEYYYDYLEFLDLLKDLKAVGVDTDKKLSRESFNKALQAIEATYTVFKNNHYGTIEKILNENDLKANLTFNYLDFSLQD